MVRIFGPYEMTWLLDMWFGIRLQKIVDEDIRGLNGNEEEATRHKMLFA